MQDWHVRRPIRRAFLIKGTESSPLRLNLGDAKFIKLKYRRIQLLLGAKREAEPNVKHIKYSLRSYHNTKEIS